jgi:hypothetical protein
MEGISVQEFFVTLNTNRPPFVFVWIIDRIWPSFEKAAVALSFGTKLAKSWFFHLGTTSMAH